MIAGIRVKVCGLRSLVDAEAADAVGADYLGFILYPKSPRCISLEQFRSLLPRLPPWLQKSKPAGKTIRWKPQVKRPQP
jgi:phosphoribosylanthranilate isomerase